MFKRSTSGSPTLITSPFVTEFYGVIENFIYTSACHNKKKCPTGSKTLILPISWGNLRRTPKEDFKYYTHFNPIFKILYNQSSIGEDFIYFGLISKSALLKLRDCPYITSLKIEIFRSRPFLQHLYSFAIQK